jgi:hypothetical protein
MELPNCKFSFISPLQTFPEGAAFKSLTGDLGVLSVTVLSNFKLSKNQHRF